jgi:hypothetical protein
VRKKQLQFYSENRKLSGAFGGAFAASVGSTFSGVSADGNLAMAGVFLALYTVHWSLAEDKFSRIRKAVRDARGENP